MSCRSLPGVIIEEWGNRGPKDSLALYKIILSRQFSLTLLICFHLRSMVINQPTINL